MGSTLCNQKSTMSHIIAQQDYEITNIIPDINFGLEKIQLLKKNNIPKYKNKKYQKYYVGNFIEGRAQGKSIVFIPNYFYYEGAMVNGLPEGQGYLTYFNRKQSYEGSFKGGLADGLGVLKNEKEKNQFYFEGQWNKGEPIHGKLYPSASNNLDYIELTNFVESEGIIRYKNGQVYEGQLNTYFEPHGRGVLKYGDSSLASQYNGEWFRSKFHGKGTFNWKNKAMYSGDYLYGNKHGEGTFVFPSGNYYEGHWAGGLQHGKGILYDRASKIIQKGIWINGALVSSNITSDSQFSCERLPNTKYSDFSLQNAMGTNTLLR